MNTTIIAYRENGADYCRGSCMARSDSEFDMSFFEHEGTNTKPLIEDMSNVIKDYLYEEYLYENDREIQRWEVTILVDGAEIENYSPYESLRSNVMNLAKKKAEKMFIEYKNEKIRLQQAKDDEAEIKATEKRKADFEKLRRELYDE